MTVDFSVLRGEHLVRVTGLESGSDDVVFTCASGNRFRMHHYQDCCESVSVEEVIGDTADLQDALVIDAREEVGGPELEAVYGVYAEWTFYLIQTTKGAVTIRWYGTSNGYYSTSVYFERLP